MKIIDVNTSLGRRDARGKIVDTAELLRVLDDYRIDKAVCYHYHALLDPRDGNLKMKAACEKSGGRLGLGVVLDPVLGADCLPGEGDLAARLTAFGAEAIHIFPNENRCALHPLYWQEICEAAGTAGLPVILEADYDDLFCFCLPGMLEAFPQVNFILVRYGLCRARHLNPLMKKYANIYCTAENLLDNDQIEEMSALGLTGHLLFATAYPLLPPAGALGLALWANISEKEKEGILAGNWEGLR